MNDLYVVSCYAGYVGKHAKYQGRHLYDIYVIGLANARSEQLKYQNECFDCGGCAFVDSVDSDSFK